MILLEADKEALSNITKAIDGFSGKAPTILKEAANETGKQAMRRYQEEIKRRYDYDENVIELKKRMRRKSATYSNPASVITASSPIFNMADFNVTPHRVAYGGSRPKAYRGRVLRTSSVKTLQFGKKAFMVRFDNGHEGLVERVPGKEYTDPEKKAERERKKMDITKIKAINSTSMRPMLGKAYSISKDDMALLLKQNMRKYIDRFNRRVRT